MLDFKFAGIKQMPKTRGNAVFPGAVMPATWAKQQKCLEKRSQRQAFSDMRHKHRPHEGALNLESELVRLSSVRPPGLRHLEDGYLKRKVDELMKIKKKLKG